MSVAGSILTLGSIILQLGSTPIWVPLLILLLVILLFWWGLTRNNINELEEETAEHHSELEAAHAEEITEQPEAEVESEEFIEPDVDPEPVTGVEPDDLKLIEGIGPKITSVLAEAGIVTFAQLAEMDEQQLTIIVRDDAGIKLAKPATWPKQAHLAATGRWEDLEKLQEELHGGLEKS